MLAVARDFYQSLGLAYHVVNIVSGEVREGAHVGCKFSALMNLRAHAPFS